ncbi:MAG TPA: hypothetical protein VFY85_09150 [Gemmatimonadaceae bacterium]|nr:hypothetical protein [Gemmatimonadaceae bacterium]
MRALAWILALFLLVAGIWGFFSPVVFMFFTTNFVHACIEVLLGLIGLAAARRHARGYLLWVGALLLLVGIVYFVPVASLYVTGLLAVNTYLAAFNIIVGGICMIVALSERREPAPVR